MTEALDPWNTNTDYINDNNDNSFRCSGEDKLGDVAAAVESRYTRRVHADKTCIE